MCKIDWPAPPRLSDLTIDLLNDLKHRIFHLLPLVFQLRIQHLSWAALKDQYNILYNWKPYHPGLDKANPLQKYRRSCSKQTFCSLLCRILVWKLRSSTENSLQFLFPATQAYFSLLVASQYGALSVCGQNIPPKALLWWYEFRPRANSQYHSPR